MATTKAAPPARKKAEVGKINIRSLRSTLEGLTGTDDLLITDVEVNPALELAGLAKQFDGGSAMLFNKVKGYANARLTTNLFATEERISHLFGIEDIHKFKFKCVDAIHKPILPEVVKEAPCQEVVIDKNINVWDIVPMIQHTEKDPGRTLGGGNTLVTGKYFWGGDHISYNRMNFRGPDFSSFQISPGSHTDMIATEWYHKGPIPMTINMGVPPACTLLAGGGFCYMILPKGCSELGVAGAMQGYPVELVKARTVDALSIAQAEYVIEGYLDTTQKVWESEIAEKENKQGVYPFHPEWAGYMGKAYRTYKFQVTAVTHRKEKPIYYPSIVHSYDDKHIDTLMREAMFFELADRICPGLCVDTHIALPHTDWGGVVFQIKKRRARDEGFQKNILAAALSTSLGLRMALAVDEDINIYSMEDLMWAITTRIDPSNGIQIVARGGAGQTFQPADRSSAGDSDWTQSNIRFGGGIAYDATMPFKYKDAFERPPYPVKLVDSSKWFGDDDIAGSIAKMTDYGKYLARTGY